MRRVELYRLVPDNATAIIWCRSHLLLKSKMLCPTCKHDMKLVRCETTDGEIWRCNRTVSGERHFRKVHIRDGSIFAGSHVSISDLVYLLYEWSRNTSVDEASYELEMATSTVIEWYKTFRETAAWFVEQRQQGTIGGPGQRVELDECQIGRRKYQRGRLRNDVWVLGGIVRGSNPTSCFLEIVKKRDMRTLSSVIQRKVDRRTIVITDGWRGYRGLLSLGYNHSIVNHSENFVSQTDPTVHTQSVESMWSRLRRFLNKKGGYRRTHLPLYLLEFVFRVSYVDVFEHLITAIDMRFPC
jgi:transposase-like protein